MDDDREEDQLGKKIKFIDPHLFFYDAIKKAQTKQSIQLSENVEYYLVQLLMNFIRADEQNSLTDCLIIMVKKALEGLPNERIVLYKKIGDIALYVCGFHQDYFANKSYDIKYYISMGSAAYKNLSNLMLGRSTYQNTMAQIYHDMSSHFLNAIEILLHISENMHHNGHQRSTLNIYDAWLNTESKKLCQDLLDRGIIPTKIGAKKIQ